MTGQSARGRQLPLSASTIVALSHKPRWAAAVLASALLAGCAADQGASVIRQDRIDAAQRADIAARWKPRLVLGDEALLRGEPIRSPASAKASGMFYPAPTPAAGLAALMAHSAIESNAQNDRRRAEADAADAVAAPYQDRVARTPPERLLTAALQRSRVGARPLLPTIKGTPAAADASVAASADPEVRLTPVYRMAQSQRAILLDLAVHAVVHGRGGDRAFETLVRVVSDPLPEDGTAARERWLARDGEPLEEGLVALLSTAIDLAADDLSGQFDAAGAPAVAGAAGVSGAAGSAGAAGAAGATTSRLKVGDQTAYERGTVLRESCGRVTLRTLRGWVVDAPKAQPAADCKAAAG